MYGTDKGVSLHGFVDRYEEHLSGRRRSVRKVLEIGVYRGASLWMWHDYFPNAEIIGLDIEHVAVSGPRIRCLVGDQSDPEILAQVRRHGPFDLIVDDGSHVGAHIRASFEALFGALRPGGWYVIEDMETAYWPNFGGGAVGHSGTSVSLVKELADAVNRRHAGESGGGLPPVASVHLYEEIAFIQHA